MTDKTPKRLIESEGANPVAELLRRAGSEDPAPTVSARARVWARLDDTPRRTTPGLLIFAGVAAIALLAVGLGLALKPGANEAAPFAVVAAHGDFQVTPSAVEAPRHTFEAVEGSGLVNVGRVAVEAQRKTKFVIEERTLELAHGQVRIDVPSDASVRLIAGPFTAVIHDAEIEIEHIGARGLKVFAMRGSVVVRGEDEAHEISEGMRRTLRDRIAANVEKSGDPERAGPEPKLQAVPSDPLIAKDAVRADRAPRPSTAKRSRKQRRRTSAAARRRARAEEASAAPAARKPAVPSATLPTKSETTATMPTKSETTATLPPESETTATLPSNPEATAMLPSNPEATKASPPAEAAKPAPTASGLYARANRTKSIDEALRLYDEAEALGGPYAELAAYRAGRAAMRRGLLREATRRFEAMLSRYPRGTMRPEVSLNLVDCALRQDDLGKAQKRLAAYLGEFSAGQRGGELYFLRAEVSRRSGACASAIPDYRRAETSRRASEALYFRAWCERDLGNSAAARQLLRSYVDRFPSGRHRAEALRVLSDESKKE